MFLKQYSNTELLFLYIFCTAIASLLWGVSATETTFLNILIKTNTGLKSLKSFATSFPVKHFVWITFPLCILTLLQYLVTFCLFCLYFILHYLVDLQSFRPDNLVQILLFIWHILMKRENNHEQKDSHMNTAYHKIWRYFTLNLIISVHLLSQLFWEVFLLKYFLSMDVKFFKLGMIFSELWWIITR